MRCITPCVHSVWNGHFAADLRLLHAIETLSNPQGLLALTPSADAAVLACPGLHAGQVCTQDRRQERTRCWPVSAAAGVAFGGLTGAGAQRVEAACSL
jgi:hypothetical protein